MLRRMGVLVCGLVLGACAVTVAPAATRSIATSRPLPTAPGTPTTPETSSTAPTTVVEPTVSAPVPAPTTVATTTTVPATRSIELAFVGDILPHSPLWRGAARIAEADGRDGYDFDPMLAELAPLLERADLAVCHLETPIAPDGEELSTVPLYGVPAEIADAIAAAGFDHCSTASNHSLDRGVAGVDRTVSVLEAAGVTQSGMARVPEEIWPRVLDVSGVAVAHLSYTWSFNGIPLPRDEPWRSASIDPDRILLDAETARLLGAEVVVVSLHWGAEQVHDVTRYQREIADRITADGSVDLIVGHHAHVLQPVERVNGTWVMFGLSNVLSNLPASPSWTRASQDAAVALVRVEVDTDGVTTVGRPELHPTWVDKQAEWTVRVVADELERGDLDPNRLAALEASWDRSMAIVGEFVPERRP